MSKWSLNGKMILIISVFVFACGAISFVGIKRMSEINHSLDMIVKEDSKRVQGGAAIRSLYKDLIIDEKNIIMLESKEEMDKIKTRLDKNLVEFEKIIPEFQNSLLPAGKKSMDEFIALKNKWVENNKLIQKYAYADDNKSATHISAGAQRELRMKMEEILGDIIERNKNRMDQSAVEAEQTYTTARNVMTVTSIIAILIGLSIAVYVLRKVDQAIDQVINHLTDNSNQVTTAAQQIASSSVELSQATTEQSASLEQTSASVEEMNSMVQKNADNAQKTSQLSESSKAGANRGQTVVQEMITAIHEINQSNDAIKGSIDESNKQFEEIISVINEIGTKTKVINDIVFQTKLLSFNASVEAARAGEQGKGFAVVAEEVGNLAQMSGKAATEISSMLDASIVKVESIVKETKSKVEVLVSEGHTKVVRGARIAEECGKVLEDIVGNVTSVSQMSEEISVACQEQAQGVSEITKAMAQLDQVTQTNAATSEETAQAAEELSAQAKSLRDVVGVLVETIKGAKAEGEVATFGSYHAPAKDVLEFKKERKTTPVSVAKTKNIKPTNLHVVKKASGAGDSVPNHSDMRFEEV